MEYADEMKILGTAGIKKKYFNKNIERFEVEIN